MKARSIKQPWATLICTGLKNVENRTRKPALPPGRFLIHASSTRVSGKGENDLSEPISHVKNARLMGQVPECQDFPVGAVIGDVECFDIPDHSDGLWAEAGCRHGRLWDAPLFNQPIYGIKGAQGRLFDVPEVEESRGRSGENTCLRS